MAVKFEPVVTTSITRQIAEQIRESILEGRLKSGDRLPSEHDLAAQFSVSRPTIREALKLLAAQNLVRSRRGPTGGTFVKRPTGQEAQGDLATTTGLLISLGEFNLSEIAEAREELAQVCGRLAAQRRDAGHVARLRAEVDIQLHPDLSDEEFCASDVRFHRALADAAGNDMLGFVMNAVIEALEPVETKTIFRLRDRAKIIKQHQRIVDAIADGDLKRTRKAIAKQSAHLRSHFDKAQNYRNQGRVGTAR